VQPAEVLITHMQRSACDGVSCIDAATADFFLGSVQNASFGR
jgi:hypothetical protein